MQFLDNIIAWDRAVVSAVNEWHTPFFDHFFWLISETAVWAPALIALIIILIRNKKIESMWIMATMVLMFLFVDQVAAEIIKPWVGRLRPTHDMLLIPVLDIVNDYRGGYYGFVSNHAANVFVFACFSALLFKHQLYTFSIFAWACLVSFSRLYLAVHFPTDLMAGALFGMLSAWAFYLLYQAIVSRNNEEYTINKYQYTKSLYKKNDICILLIILATILISLLMAAYYIY